MPAIVHELFFFELIVCLTTTQFAQKTNEIYEKKTFLMNIKVCFKAQVHSALSTVPKSASEIDVRDKRATVIQDIVKYALIVVSCPS